MVACWQGVAATLEQGLRSAKITLPQTRAHRVKCTGTTRVAQSPSESDLAKMKAAIFVEPGRIVLDDKPSRMSAPWTR